MLYDREMRDPLCYYLEDRFGKVRILDEVPIGHARADLMLTLPMELIGIEIKSNMDTYDRLKRQVRNYDLYFDRNYAAVGSRHAVHIFEHIPAHWGVLCIREEHGNAVVTELRPATAGPARKNRPMNQLSFLWKRELFHILDANRLPKYRGQSKPFIREKLLGRIAWESLKQAICEELFERDYTVEDPDEP